MAERRTLVLSVDRDDDIGYKAGLESPVVGRDACLAAANALALVDPEDSDVNAIFQAVKVADGLAADGEEVEVAIVAGDHLRMIEGDRKIARDLERVIARTGATECILVTDGAEDDFVLPIIQSRIAVSSVRRVVVTQMVNLEGTYYILKKLLDDPKISRPLLVPVGLAMLLFAIAYLLGYPEGAMIVVVGVIGVYLLFRGLGYEDIFGSSYRALATSLSHGRFTLVTNLAAVLLMIIGAITGITTMIVHYMGGDQANGLFMVLAFAYGAIPWWVSAGLVSSAGRLVDVWLGERGEVWRVLLLPFLTLAAGLFVYGAAIYVLAVNRAPEFPILAEAALQYFAALALAAGVCLAIGLWLQHSARRSSGDGDTRRPSDAL
jgi:putative membrane protein